MRIFNDDKTVEYSKIDLEKGYLKSDRLFIRHHEACDEVKEEGHYEVVCEYENGGKDLMWVVDVPAHPAREAYDEYEDIYIFVPFSDEELAQHEIAALKIKLSNTDYQALKYAEGFISEEDYKDTKALRQAWRDRINLLEKTVTEDMENEDI